MEMADMNFNQGKLVLESSQGWWWDVSFKLNSKITKLKMFKAINS